MTETDFYTQNLSIDGLNATLNVWPTQCLADATPIHFAHGNGLPSRCYRQMLEPLAARRSVFALDHRATWLDAPRVPHKSFSWADAANDMIAAIEQVAPNGVIGVGHSLGGVMTLLAAQQRPDLFKQIILIEPVLFPTRMFVAAAWMPMNWRLRYFPIAKRTALRQDVWRSRAEFAAYHARKNAFAGIATDVMDDYAAHGLRACGEQFELTFPKAWEAHIFTSASYPWAALQRLSVPCIAARAEQSDWVPAVSWRKWQHIRSDCPLFTLPQVGHMAPLQKPEIMAEWLNAHLLD